MAPALTPKTTIGTLLKDYPFLLDFLADYHPELKKLTNPVMRRTVGRTATLERVAAQCDVALERLMDDVAAEVARVTGERPEIAPTRSPASTPCARRSSRRSSPRYTPAARPTSVKPRFAALIGDIEPAEIAAIEEALMAEGLPEDEVKRLCDVHVQVFADALEDHEPVAAAPGPPHRHLPAREPGVAADHAVHPQSRGARSARRRAPPNGSG